MRKIPLDEVIAGCDHLFNSNNVPALGEHLRHWLGEAHRLGDRESELSILNELMGHYRMSGDETRALEAVNDGLRLLDALGAGKSVSGGTILINAATALQAFKHFDQAGKLYAQAYEAYSLNLPENDVRFAGLFNNMASVFAASGDIDTAEAYYLAALEVIKVSGNLMDMAVTLVNLAQLGRNSDGYFDQAMAVFNAPEAVRDGYYAHTCGKCAGAFREFGREQDAALLIARAEEFYENH